LIGQMPEMAAVRGQAVIAIPVVGQLYRTFRLTFGGQENKGETPPFILDPSRLLQPEEVVEGDGSFQVFDPDHRVQIADLHSRSPFARNLAADRKKARARRPT